MASLIKTLLHIFLAGLKFEGLRKDKRARMKDDEAKKENDDAGSFPQPRLDFHRFKYFPRLLHLIIVR